LKPQVAVAEVVEDHLEDLSKIVLCYLHQYLLLLFFAEDKLICQSVQIFQLLIYPFLFDQNVGIWICHIDFLQVSMSENFHLNPQPEAPLNTGKLISPRKYLRIF